MATNFTIAQVTPYPWDSPHEVNRFIAGLSQYLTEAGHQTVILAPSHSSSKVRESRKIIRKLTDDELQLSDLAPNQVLEVGELISVPGSHRRVSPPPPVDISRNVGSLLREIPLDFVHVHEPFAPSTSSVALRHSTSLNLGTFHSATPRPFSTQVARRFIELFFGRLDARVACYQTTAAMMHGAFGGDYRVIRPAATPAHQRATEAGPRIVFAGVEERSALRVFLRALKRLPADLDWNAVVVAENSTTGGLANSLRQRVQWVSPDEVDRTEVLRPGDLAIACSHGPNPSPGYVIEAIATKALPIVSALPIYEELTGQGINGLVFPINDADTLACHITSVLADPVLHQRHIEQGQRLRDELTWSGVGSQYNQLFEELAARRHDNIPKPQLVKRLADRPEIEVDLHMHTDHSYDCATPVEVLLKAAKERGLGAIAVTDHNEISGALDAERKAEQFGMKVIVGEEIKTANQGEVIGLFLREKIERGLTLEETIAAIRNQGGLVYVPHPFDRLHSVPDYEHLLGIIDEIDILEIFNPRIAVPAFNEEAARFAAKYNLIAGAGSDSHVAQGLGSVRIRMKDFEGPEEFLESIREADIIRRPSSLLYVQALKFLQTKATPAAARRAARARRVRKAIGDAPSVRRK